MDNERREQLREMIRTEPHVRAVLEPLLGELATTQAHCDALKVRVDELHEKLADISNAKQQVESSSLKQKSKAEPAKSGK